MTTVRIFFWFRFKPTLVPIFRILKMFTLKVRWNPDVMGLPHKTHRAFVTIWCIPTPGAGVGIRFSRFRAPRFLIHTRTLNCALLIRSMRYKLIMDTAPAYSEAFLLIVFTHQVTHKLRHHVAMEIRWAESVLRNDVTWWKDYKINVLDTLAFSVPRTRQNRVNTWIRMIVGAGVDLIKLS